jgi:regulator of sigma E protease
MSWVVFLLALTWIVAIHEWGHYGMARFFNVAMDTFSLGFGKPLYTWRSKKTGTLFCIAPILIGGYVKFADESIGERVLFDKLASFKKILILLAGPLSNLISAFIFLWAVYSMPHYQPYALFNPSGDNKVYQIKTINHQRVKTWADVWAVIKNAENRIDMELFPESSLHLTIKYAPHTLDEFLKKMKWRPILPKLPAIVGGVKPNSQAQKVGLQAGDEIMAINYHPIDSMNTLAKQIKQFSPQGYRLDWRRQGALMHANIVPTNQQPLGVYTKSFAFYPHQFVKQFLPVNETFKQTRFSFLKLFSLQTHALLGLPSHLQYIAGPVGVAISAQEAWGNGWRSYLLFIVWLSISIGVLNLFPLPILDGGQCIIVVLKALFPKLLTDNIKYFLTAISFFMLVILLFIGSFNDWALLQK